MSEEACFHSLSLSLSLSWALESDKLNVRHFLFGGNDDEIYYNVWLFAYGLSNLLLL